MEMLSLVLRVGGLAVQTVTTGITAVLGGYLASLVWWYPFAANAVLLTGGIAVLLTFPASGRFADRDSDSTEDRFTVLDALPLLREQFTKPPLRSFVLYTALFFALIGAARIYIQPISTQLGVPVAYLSWLYAGFSAVTATVSYYGEEIRQVVGLRRWFLAVPLALAGLFVGVILVPLAALPMFFGMRAVRGLTRTFRSQYVNDHTESLGRATVLSTVSMVSGLFGAGAGILSGIVADAIGPIMMLGVFGGAFVVCAGVLFWLESPLPATLDPSTTASGD
jgi:MFS family permease